MRILPYLLLLVLSACASVPDVHPVKVTDRETSAFNINGRLAVKHLSQRHNGGLRWQHMGMHDELLLQGPLGITGARIVSDEHAASLEQNGKRYEAADVESLMQQVLGWGLPLQVLHHWLLGVADASLPVEIERDELGRITVMHQAGWEVRYTRYVDDSAQSLPARIMLSRTDIQVQLLIDEWEWP